MPNLPPSMGKRADPPQEMGSTQDGSPSLQGEVWAAVGRAWASAYAAVGASTGPIHGPPGRGESEKTAFPVAGGPGASHLGTHPGSGRSKPLRRILVVDDDPNVALTLQAGLEILPHCQVLVAPSGKRAVQLLEEESFELLITDYRMPGADGMILAKYVREISPRTAVVLITAYSSDELREQAVCASVYCVLDKPVRLAEVRRLALEVLEGSSGGL